MTTVTTTDTQITWTRRARTIVEIVKGVEIDVHQRTVRTKWTVYWNGDHDSKRFFHKTAAMRLATKLAAGREDVTRTPADGHRLGEHCGDWDCGWCDGDKKCLHCEGSGICPTYWSNRREASLFIEGLRGQRVRLYAQMYWHHLTEENQARPTNAVLNIPARTITRIETTLDGYFEQFRPSHK
jgi:hypothetical protein